ncbi:MAG: ring-cleaving dioxygenase [Pseudomonadota bacterium]
MQTAISGLHHVTAMCASPQENIDFYVKSLGRRLVKRTVNFDEPGTYHLYYGDHAGSPGTIITFFPFVDAGPGRAGPGMASAMALSAPVGGIGDAAQMLAEHGIDFAGPVERFGESVIAFADPDRMPLEIVERPGQDYGHIAGITLWVRDPEPSARVLTDVMGLTAMGEERDGQGQRLRFKTTDGTTVDLLRAETRVPGAMGAGTFHHVAFRVPDHETHLAWRERVAAAGLDVTPVIDRQYFDAIYFREPGGVLFEIATDPPGFATDEPVETLGRSLKLPPRYEAVRGRIEKILPPIRVPA